MEEGFDDIKKIRTDIKIFFERFKKRKEQMRSYYKEYIEKNKKNDMFGLDSFHFQSKLLELESTQLTEQYLLIDNRIYCDYYKLYEMIRVFHKKTFKIDIKKREYPIYKDLEPLKCYRFEDINHIHYDIIEMINQAYKIIEDNKNEIMKHSKLLKIGINIENYVHNHRYKNDLLLTNIKLYESYLKSYHIYHMSFLSKLKEKIILIFRQTDGKEVTSKEVETECPDVRIEVYESITELEPVPQDIEPITEPDPEPEPQTEPVPEDIVPITEPEPQTEPQTEPVPECPDVRIEVYDLITEPEDIESNESTEITVPEAIESTEITLPEANEPVPESTEITVPEHNEPVPESTESTLTVTEEKSQDKPEETNDKFDTQDKNFVTNPELAEVLLWVFEDVLAEMQKEQENKVNEPEQIEKLTEEIIEELTEEVTEQLIEEVVEQIEEATEQIEETKEQVEVTEETKEVEEITEQVEQLIEELTEQLELTEQIQVTEETKEVEEITEQLIEEVVEQVEEDTELTEQLIEEVVEQVEEDTELTEQVVTEQVEVPVKPEVAETSTQTDLPEPEQKKKRVYKKKSKVKESL